MTIQNDYNNNHVGAIRCSFHEPREGFATKSAHKHYCEQNPDTVKPINTSNEHNLTANLASEDDPIFFWQLYSILGEAPIRQIVTAFYQRVFVDYGAPWFRDAFVEVAPLQHHIETQVAYWVDAMGGGRRYHGGEYRLKFHHENNAKQVMTARGAERWMYHMRAVLEAVKFDDGRVKPCILDFLTCKMKVYADQFGWAFDENDMVLYQD